MDIRLTFLVENHYEQPFLAIPKPNAYRFFTKKWSPLKPLAPDLWQGNNYGVRNRSISQKIDEHTTNIFAKNRYERPFSTITKANTYEFITKKWSLPFFWKIVYDKKICVGKEYKPLAKNRWAYVKNTMNKHFRQYRRLTTIVFSQKMS